MNKHYFDSEKAPVRILTISSLLDEWDNRHLLTEFQQYLNDGFQQFIVDLTNLHIINSVGINFLLRILKKVQQVGGQLFLANASVQVTHLLNITKLTSIFSMEDSVDAALEAMQEEQFLIAE